MVSQKPVSEKQTQPRTRMQKGLRGHIDFNILGYVGMRGLASNQSINYIITKTTYCFTVDYIV
jgi:hypothetical protein